MTIGWWREDRNLNKPKIKEKIIRVEDPRLKELEMQLKKHNEIIDELEKLLDSNMGNIDASEYAKLKAEHDKMIAERDALAKAFDEAKAESGALVDKVVATEQERDTHKVHIDKLVEGAGVFEKRIEDLINQISDLEAEIVRRDQVVLKMAQKYQLIEKDEFCDDLVAQVTDEKKP